MNWVSLALGFSGTTAYAAPQGPIGLDAHGFQLAAFDADARDPLTLQRPGRMRQSDWYAGALLEYADEPMIGTTSRGKEIPFVDDLVAANLSVGSVAHERVRIDASAPVYLGSVGPEGQRGPGFGDVRLGGLLLLVAPPEEERGFGLGLSPFLDIPTGDEGAFLGQSGLAGGAIGSVTGGFQRLTLTVNSGFQVNPAVDLENLMGSDTVLVGIGANYSPNRSLGVGYEIRGALPLRVSTAQGTGAPFEGLISGRYVDDTGGFLVAGAAMGLTPGVGAATFRLVLGGGFGSADSLVYDADGDGVLDAEDACPTAEGLADNQGCSPKVVLRVTAALDGQTVGGADMVIEGLQTFEVTSGGLAVPLDVPVESMWRGSATLGDCLAGDKIVQVRDADVSMVIPLVFRPSAQVRVAVRDVNGDFVDDVRVRFESSDPYCEPPQIPAMTSEGRLLVDIGSGSHKLIVDAEGYRPHEETFSVGHSDERELFVLLVPR
jgi:hypothetical protein